MSKIDTSGINYNLQDYTIFVRGDGFSSIIYLDSVTDKQYRYRELNREPENIDTSGDGHG